ncbi:MAG TPA: hypothetical protein VL793_15210 [Patescibacteria group bacterium]|nr:hypothetical protein [Patescibacteria group bacterium]
MRQTTLAGILVLVPIVALVLLVEFQPRRPPKVSVNFLAYTNDSTGARVAKFVVSNFESSSVLVSAPLVCIQTATNELGHGAGGGMLIVKAHASSILTIPSPPDNAVWRIHLRVYPDFGLWREVKSFVMYKLIKFGLKPNYGNMPYGIDGTWLKSE